MMRAVIMKGLGGPEVLSVANNIPRPSITNQNQVLMRVKATAVNRADTMQRKGHYPPPPGESNILGLEAAGIIESVGSSVSKWKPGDQVMALLPGGGYGEYVNVPEGLLMPIPVNMSFAHAAAITEVFLTAWQCLHFHANVKKHDVVLIHAGASGVGTAASQLCHKVFGAKAVTTSSADKVEDCLKYANVAVSRTFDPETKTTFESKIRNALGGNNKVNVVIDPVFGGGYFNENVNVCAMDATIIVISMIGGTMIENYNASSLFKKRINIKFSTIRNRDIAYKCELVKSFTEQALPFFDESTETVKRLFPVINRILPLEEVQEAHRMIDASVTVGKVILTF